MATKVKNTTQTGRWVLFATILASSMAFIDGSALNVALPALQDDLGATGADLLWIINAYALFLAALILVGGSLGDHLGRKRIFGIGIILFTIASVACGLAPSTGFLIVARAVQGVGGALMVPGSLAIISAYFDDTQRGQAIGTWSAFTTLTSVAGPLLGGFLADNGLWRVIFFINIPLAIPALYALYRYIPESYDEEAPKELDYLGAFLITIGLAGFTYGFIELGRRGIEQGLTDVLVLLSIIVGFVALILFIVVQARSDHPMMPLKLFRSRTFSGANLLTFLLYGVLGGSLFFLPLNLIQVQGYDATVAGLALLPFSIALILLSRWAGGLVDRYGPRLPLTVGPTIVGFAFVVFALVGVTNGPADYWVSFFPAAILFGIGMGITVAPLTTAVMGSVPQHFAGIASGVNNAMSRSSQVFAVAILGGVALILFSQSLTANTADIDLSDQQRTALAEEAQNLADAAVPEGLSDETTQAVNDAIDVSFVETFRIIMIIGAVASWFSALAALILVENRLTRAEM